MADSSVISEKYGGGPFGLGDPDDQTLRSVEKEVLIPKKMRDLAREKCEEEVKQFTECCKNNKVLMVVYCRNENSALKNCVTRWYQDEEFKNQCTSEYLKERSEYRRTGVGVKAKETKLPVSM